VYIFALLNSLEKIISIFGILFRDLLEISNFVRKFQNKNNTLQNIKYLFV